MTRDSAVVGGFPHHGSIYAIVDDFVPDIVLQITDGVVNVEEGIPEFIRIKTIDVLSKRRSKEIDFLFIDVSGREAHVLVHTYMSLTVPFKVGSDQRAWMKASAWNCSFNVSISPIFKKTIRNSTVA